MSVLGLPALIDSLADVLPVGRDRSRLQLPDQLGAPRQPLGNGDVALLAAALVHPQILGLREPSPLDQGTTTLTES